MSRSKYIFVILGVLAIRAFAAAQLPARDLTVVVTDSNHYVIVGATCALTRGGKIISTGITDESGNATFTGLQFSLYDLQVEKRGFAKFEKRSVQTSEEHNSIAVMLNVSTLSADVRIEDLSANPRSIESGASVSAGSITRQAAERLPLATKRVDEAIPLVPGVIRSSDGQISINGSNEQQSAFHVNGLNVADPASGNFRLNLPVDAVESVQVFRHPYSAEFGQFTGGLTNIETRGGGDKWHFEINDFLPDLRFINGTIMGVRDDTPHVNFNGPIVANKLFISQSLGYSISKTPVRGLSFPVNETIAEGQSYFTQLNLTASDKHSEVLTLGYFPERQSFIDLDFFRPRMVTPNYKQRDFVGTFRDNYALRGGLLQTSLSFKRFEAHVWGQGEGEQVLTPVGQRGNYFAKQDRRSSRLELFEMYETPPFKFFRGRHTVKTGFNFTDLSSKMLYVQRPVNILRFDGTLASRTTFESTPLLSIRNRTYTGFVQDRWILRPNFSVDIGMRFEDQRIASGQKLAPRAGFAWSPFARDRTIVRGGVGYFYDKVPLNIRAFGGFPIRTVTQFAPDGHTVISQTRFENILVNNVDLVPLDFSHDRSETGFVPVNLTWNLQVDQTIGRRLDLRLNYTNSSTDSLYIVTPQTDFFGRQAIVLTPSGRTSYRALEMTAKLALPKAQQFNFSYVRSKARGDLNEFNGYYGDFGFPVVRANQSSNLSTDVPDRVIAWGSVALPRKISVSPIIEWRTGFPYSVVSETQDFVGVRNAASQRFPHFFSIDTEVSRDFQVTKKYGVRLSLKGFNLTNHFNPRNVRNNLSDPQFGRFINNYGRYFSGGFDVLF